MARAAAEKGVSILGDIILGLIDILKKLFRPILIFIFAIILFTLVVSWFATMVGGYFTAPILEAMSFTTPALTYLGFGNAIFILGIPLVGMALLGARLLFKARMAKKWSAGLFFFWLLNAVSLGLIAGSAAKGFTDEAEMSSQTPVPVADSLMIEFRDSPETSIAQLDYISKKGDKLILEDVNLHIQEGKSDEFRLEKKVQSRGSNKEEALALLDDINDPFEISGNTLFIDPYFTIPTSGKWRMQEVDLTLYVPPGKSFHIERTYDVLSSLEVHEESPGRRPFSGNWWTMQEGGAIKFVEPENTKQSAESPQTSESETIKKDTLIKNEDKADTSNQE